MRVFRIIVFVLLAISVFFIVRHYMKSEETRVREVIDDLISDLKSDNVALSLWGIRGNLAEDYAHRESGLDMVDRELTLSFISALKQNSGLVAFEVDIREMRVRMEGDTAQVIITGRISAAKGGQPAERIEVMTEPGLNQVEINLRQLNGKWLVTSSQRIRYQLPD